MTRSKNITRRNIRKIRKTRKTQKRKYTRHGGGIGNSNSNSNSNSTATATATATPKRRTNTLSSKELAEHGFGNRFLIEQIQSFGTKNNQPLNNAKGSSSREQGRSNRKKLYSNSEKALSVRFPGVNARLVRNSNSHTYLN